MGRDTLTGSRIRERRVIAGMRQAELARLVDISASYLNLIEHNKRRIGGKLLVDIAQILGVEPSLLSEGAEAALVARLKEAAATFDGANAETDRADEFAGRFPGWARLIGQMHGRLEDLEQTAIALSDRLTHDPYLAASMHEVLTMVTAIRSTAGILADTQELEPEWRNRFHRNINEDSQRLAESSQRLVSYLDAAADAGESMASPQEELDAMLQANNFHFECLETQGGEIADVLTTQSTLTSGSAQAMAQDVLAQYAQDAQDLPQDVLLNSVQEIGLDPATLAHKFGVSIPTVMRRLVALPEGTLDTNLGLVACDASGTLVFRKPVDGFSLPRHSAACPKWPLFNALSRPGVPIKEAVAMTGRDVLQFDCYAVAEPYGPQHFNQTPLLRAYMLIIPSQTLTQAAPEVGQTCRICPSANCLARREPSVLLEGV